MLLFSYLIFYGLNIELSVRFIKCKTLNNNEKESFSWDFFGIVLVPRISHKIMDEMGGKRKRGN
jgi:hypothetical protein